MAGLVGDNLAFPFWAIPPDAEYKAGMTFHGETGIAAVQAEPGASADTLVCLPMCRNRTTRFTVVLVEGQIRPLRGVREN